MSTPIRTRAAIVALLAALAAAACSDLLAPPAASRATLSLSYALSPGAPPSAQTGVGRAFDRVNQVQVRLSRGQELVLADSFAVTPADSGVIRRTLGLRLRQPVEEMTLDLRLLTGTQVLFTGSQQVTLARGEQVSAEVPLHPVAGSVSIRLPSATTLYRALGDTFVARAVVLFASGDTVPGAPVTWSSLDPAVLQVLADGRLVPLQEGSARVRAASGAAGAEAVFTYVAHANSVTLSPDSATIMRGDSVRFTATVRDRRGNVLERALRWFTSDRQVADVSRNNTVYGLGAGRTLVTASTAHTGNQQLFSASGSATLVVLPRRGHLAVSVVNAANGRPVPGATVWALRSNAPPNSPPSATAVSDTAGMARMAGLVEDTYVVVASAPGMITAATPNVVLAPDQATLLRSVLSPVLRPGQTRIVVTWDGAPTDLDAHLTGPDPYGGTFHVFDRAPTSLAEDSTVAVRLDRNDTSGHGPETVTIYQQLQGTYCFSLHHYAGAGSLATSAALVRVFRESQQVTAFNVPNTTNRVWTVFRMEGDTITPVNTTGSTVPGVCP